MRRLEHAYGWRLPMSLLLLGPGSSYIEVANGSMTVVMGWAFRLKAPLSEIESARLEDEPVPWKLGIGVHFWGGEWAVNATRRPHVIIKFKSPQKGRTAGIPIRVRVLHLCPAEPEKLLEEITSG